MLPGLQHIPIDVPKTRQGQTRPVKRLPRPKGVVKGKGKSKKPVLDATQLQNDDRVLFVAFGTWGVFDPDMITSVLKTEFNNVQLRARLARLQGSSDDDKGSYNEGVYVKDSREALDSWLEIETFSNSSESIPQTTYKETITKILKNGLFYRWTQPPKTALTEAEVQSRIQNNIHEAQRMIIASEGGFGPSIYAIYMVNNGYPALHVVMDAGEPLDRYLFKMKPEGIYPFMEDLKNKCSRASMDGILLLDMKPENIVVSLNSNGAPNVMIIDYDTMFTIKFPTTSSPNDPQDQQNPKFCLYYLNLFLLVMHIKCRFPNRMEIIRTVLVELVNEIDIVVKEEDSLCGLLDSMKMEWQTVRLKMWDDQYVTHQYPKRINWNLDDSVPSEYPPMTSSTQPPNFDMDGKNTYFRSHTVAKAFIERINHYFVTGECYREFKWTPTGDLPLMEQLTNWLKEGLRRPQSPSGPPTSKKEYWEDGKFIHEMSALAM